MDPGLATAAAAVVAAIASLSTLLFTLLANRRAEMRAAHREVIAPHLEALSREIYNVIAGIVVLRKRMANIQSMEEAHARDRAGDVSRDRAAVREIESARKNQVIRARQQAVKWQDQAKKAGVRIDAVRRKIRIVLPGYEQPLRQLALASDHVATYRALPNTNVDELVEAYQELDKRISSALVRTYRTGVPTGHVRRWWLGRSVAKIERLWAARPVRPEQPARHTQQ